jgi:hypothetical protein
MRLRQLVKVSMSEIALIRPKQASRQNGLNEAQMNHEDISCMSAQTAQTVAFENMKIV